MKRTNEQRKCNLKKTGLRVFIGLFSLSILIVFLITMASTIKSSDNLAFGKYKFYIMKEGYKTGIAEKGDLIIAKKVKTDDIHIGDEIVYQDNNSYYSESVVEQREINTVTKIITAEDDGIKYQFDANDIEGKVIFKMHQVGNIIIALRTPIGTILFILLIICLFILLRILFIRNKNKCS